MRSVGLLIYWCALSAVSGSCFGEQIQEQRRLEETIPVGISYHDTTHYHRKCRMNAHVVGSWRRYERPSKSYLCCGWGANGLEHQWSTDDCGWANRAGEVLHSGHGIYYEQAGGNACSCDLADDKMRSVSDREKWEWVPLSCDLVEWNATLFCELLGNRTILLAGDSTMRQTGQALMSMTRHGTQRGDGCQNQIWNNHDNELTSSFEHADNMNVNVMVFSLGAHQWQSRKIFEAALEHAENSINMLRAKKGDEAPIFIWKSINPGHVDCVKNGGLSNYTKVRSEWSEDDTYYWYQFPRFDSYAKKWAIRNQVDIIDMSPLQYRQDAHSDCLHFCTPGPLDIFSEIMLTKLYTGEIPGGPVLEAETAQ